MSTTNFVDVTEIAGTPISAEQLERLVNRYNWAASICKGCETVEVACGTGPGLGLLATAARDLEAGDYSTAVLEVARRHYGNRVPIRQFDAQDLPCADNSKDVIILFEAIYYLPHPEKFLTECVRVLRGEGKVLITTANKDIWDFHPSAHSHRYFGVIELAALFGRYGFEPEFFGYQRIDRSPWRQRMLRPIKRAAVALNIMPKTMRGKRWLKRLVFGHELTMPAELDKLSGPYIPPEPIPADRRDRLHKIIYCAATLRPRHTV